jgi:hypothetical protein
MSSRLGGRHARCEGPRARHSVAGWCVTGWSVGFEVPSPRGENERR